MSENSRPVIEVKNLKVTFRLPTGDVRAIRGLDFILNENEVLALVGESGCGKSVGVKTVMGILPASAVIESGEVIFHDGGEKTDLLKMKEPARRKLINGTKIAMVFQDPMSSLNPKKQVGQILREALAIQGIGSGREERDRITADALRRVGIPPEYANRYPSGFSGGQRQRIGIARALVSDPKLIIADECIAALDASVQAQIVNMLHEIKEETGTSLLFISHDLSMVRFLSDRIGVLHLGYLLETGTSEEIFNAPVHPYTKGLLRAIPRMNPVMPSSESERYDPVSSGIDYALGEWHSLSPTHRVLCTDKEFDDWTEEDKG